jgi:hypothetical protein
MAIPSLQTYLTFAPGQPRLRHPVIESVRLPNGMKVPEEGLTGLSETARLVKTAKIVMDSLRQNGDEVVPVALKIRAGLGGDNLQARISKENISGVRALSLRQMKGQLVDIIYRRFNALLAQEGLPPEEVFAGGSIFITTHPELVAKAVMAEPMFDHIGMIRYEARDPHNGAVYPLTTILDLSLVDEIRPWAPGIEPILPSWERPLRVGEPIPLTQLEPTSIPARTRGGFKRAGEVAQVMQLRKKS